MPIFDVLSQVKLDHVSDGKRCNDFRFLVALDFNCAQLCSRTDTLMPHELQFLELGPGLLQGHGRKDT
ncbi:hypothetical protein AI20_00630 [Aeromonas hydrophila YL17]|nr:hypothetical protein AI20_00630 [Aeromonas hydrophila YL17]